MPSAPFPFVKTTPMVIPVAKIHPWPFNPRKLAEADRGILVEAIKSQGQLEEGKVRPHPSIAGEWELVDGECRWWGLKGAGIAEMRVQAGAWTDEQMMVIALAAKNPLNPMAQARGVAWMLEQPGATQEAVAAKVGFTQPHVQRLAQLRDALPVVTEAVEAGTLPISTACVIAKVKDEELQAEFAKAVITPENELVPMSFERAERLYKSTFSKPKRVPVAEEGEVALSAAENAKVFPAGALEPEAGSGWVCYTRPIAGDLIKPEVLAGAGAPKWCDLTEGVQVYAGMDGEGHGVKLVKLEEAFAAVTEPTVFREEAVKRHGLTGDAYIVRAAKQGKSAEEIARHFYRGGGAGEREVIVARVEAVIAANATSSATLAINQRTAEEIKKRADEKAAREEKKKAKKISKFLGQIGEAAVADGAWQHLSYVTLDFDVLLGGLGIPEIELVLGASEAARSEGAKADPRGDLIAYAGELSLDGLVGLVTQMKIVAQVRAEGVDGPTARAWHAALVDVPRPTAPEAVAFAGLPEEERKRMTELARAHAGGMSAPKLAREFSMSLQDVCGALELNYAIERDEWSGLLEALESAFVEAGVIEGARWASIKLAIGVARPLAELVPEEIKRVLEQLARVRTSKEKQATAPKQEDAA